jgi:uncharacterized protein involved in exopolysaccharide biosynthesis
MSDPASPESRASAAPPPRFPASIVFLVWLLVVLIAILVTLTLPESYSSTARIRVERDRTDIPPLSESAPVTTYDTNFIQTELAVMQSDVILSQVVAQLDLTRTWGKKYKDGEPLKTGEAIDLLGRLLRVRSVRNTSLIEITAFDDKPDAAARLANEMADTYRNYRLERRKKLYDGGIQTLKAALQANEQRVGDVGARVARLSHDPAGTNSYLVDQARKDLETLQSFGQTLSRKIASEQVDASLPASSMVEIMNTARPMMRPVRPDMGLNLGVGIVVGALGGLFLATLVYGLHLRQFRRRSGALTTQLPPRFRAIVHILIALVVGVVVGYHCATPLNWESIIVVPLTLLVGGIASAYVELARSAGISSGSEAPVRSQPCPEASSTDDQIKRAFTTPKY